jgi:hypothetical protein
MPDGRIDRLIVDTSPVSVKSGRGAISAEKDYRS